MTGVRLTRLGSCSRCGAGHVPTQYYVWAAATLSGFLCRACELWTRQERRRTA